MALHIASVLDDFAQTRNQTIKIMVAGPPGAGKTRTASTWPNPIYADVEGRLLSVRDRDVLAARIETIKDLEELKAMLDQDGSVRQRLFGRPIDTVIIDTVDEVARLVIKERLRAEKIEQMRMNDWGHLADTLRNMLRGFRNLTDVNVVFNVHLRSTEDSETGRVVYKPAIQGAVGDEIAGYVDEAFLLVARSVTDQATGKKIIVRHFQTGPDAQHDWAKDHSGALPFEFPVNFNDDYERLAKSIFGGPAVVTTPQASVQITTSEELAEEEPESVPVGKALPAKPAPRKVGRAKTQPPVTDVSLPEPEPVVPEPLVATPDAEQQAAPVETSVPDIGTESVDDDPLAELGNDAEAPAMTCTVCKATVPPDYAEYAQVRFGETLCRQHLSERQKRR